MRTIGFPTNSFYVTSYQGNLTAYLSPSRLIFLRLTTSKHQFLAEKPIFNKNFSENSFEHTITNHHLPFANLRNLRQIFNQTRSLKRSGSPERSRGISIKCAGGKTKNPKI